MPHLTRNNNFFYFSMSLVTLLLASSVADALPGRVAQLILHSIIVGTLVTSYLSLDFGGRWQVSIRVLFVLLVLMFVQEYFGGSEYRSVPGLLLISVYFMVSAFYASRQVLLSGVVNSNIIVGSISIYLLLGLVWATLYLLVLEFVPGSFHGLESKGWEENFSEAVYFSYVTLTTLGYGDISPALPLSRVLVFMEAIVGMFYMAIVVATLVGAATSNSSKSNS